MSIVAVRTGQPGQRVLLSGNEAMARGAVEAGVRVAAAYPGSPSSEVLGTLARVADRFGLYAEWSVNEIVAAEVAAAASFAGLRALTAMKPDGMNVALDVITSLAYAGCKGGMVIVVGDDPSAHSSTKDEDSRFLTRTAHLPLLEPADVAEAKEMVRTAFDLSERLGQPVVVRAVTRVCHASGDVLLGPVPASQGVPRMVDRFITMPGFGRDRDEKLAAAAAWAEAAGINSYQGPVDADTVIVAGGPAFRYAAEALELLGLEDRVGILKPGMTWPLPEPLILRHLKHAVKVIFAEEIEPFIEDNVKALAAQNWGDLGVLSFFGKKSGHIGRGELNPDILVRVLVQVLGLAAPAREAPAGESLLGPLPGRDMAFCAGCPHRASFWAIKSALALDGRRGFVLGDIGCYTMGLGRTGYHLLQTCLCMGSGVGSAGGFGKLRDFGFDQPAIAVVGDSTFYHAAVPALINARYNNAGFLTVVLDNGTTAMTGHQPHPGTGMTATGAPATPVAIEEVIGGLGIPVDVHDPYDVEGTRQLVWELLQKSGPRALILRRACALLAARGGARPRVYVVPEKCIGDACGCHRFCSRVWACPANIWDGGAKRARIDEAVCNGCGVCATLCPQKAIVVEEVD